MTHIVGKQRREGDVPLPQGVVPDDNAALKQQFLHITLAEAEAVIEPEGVDDDAERKTVAAGLPVIHSSPPYRR